MYIWSCFFKGKTWYRWIWESSGTKNGETDGEDSDEADGESGTGQVAANSSDDVDVDIDYSGCTNVKDVDTGSCAIYKTSVTMYQHRKAVYYTKSKYSCPAGYIQNGTKCIKVIEGATIDGTPVYSDGRTDIIDAKLNIGGEYTEYADYIKKKIDVEFSCPDGYTQNGAFCIKYTLCIFIYISMYISTLIYELRVTICMFIHTYK